MSKRAVLITNHAPWIFRWKKLRVPVAWRLLGTGLVAGIFAFFLSFIHVRVGTYVQPRSDKASIIYTANDPLGKSLAVHAEEMGPFPSRFEPHSWRGFAAVTAPLAEALRITSPQYVPNLRAIPPPTNTLLSLSVSGARNFPRHSPAILPANVGDSYHLAPTIYPLTSLPPFSLPSNLPRLDQEIDASFTAANWRFLLHLDPSGRVTDCFSLGGMNSPATVTLDQWLRRIPFSPQVATQNPWLCIAVEFTNQLKIGTQSH